MSATSDQLITLDGHLRRDLVTWASAPARPNGPPPVVTGKTALVGDRLRTGDVLVELDGRPVLAILGGGPAFRSLALGDHGSDVTQVQTALHRLFGTPITGFLDPTTVADIDRLYQAAGYSPPEKATGVALPMSEVVIVPRNPTHVTEMRAAYGEPVVGDYAELSAGRWRVIVPLDGDEMRFFVPPFQPNMVDTVPPVLAFGEGPVAYQPATFDVVVVRRDRRSGQSGAYAIIKVGGRSNRAVNHLEQQVIVVQAARHVIRPEAPGR